MKNCKPCPDSFCKLSYRSIQLCPRPRVSHRGNWPGWNPATTCVGASTYKQTRIHIVPLFPARHREATLAAPWRSHLMFPPHFEIATAPSGPRNDTGERKVRHAEVVMPYKGSHPTGRFRRPIPQGNPRGTAVPLVSLLGVDAGRGTLSKVSLSLLRLWLLSAHSESNSRPQARSFFIKRSG